MKKHDFNELKPSFMSVRGEADESDADDSPGGAGGAGSAGAPS